MPASLSRRAASQDANQQQVIELGGTAEQDIDGEEGIAIAHAFELHANENALGR